MPLLTHLNDNMNKINKRIVKAQMKQITEMMPDVPPPPTDSDVNTNYLSLMKSLTTILLSLREIYAYRFDIQPEGEAEDYDLPDLPEGFGEEEGSQFSGVQSQASQGSQMSYAPIGSVASAVSQPFFRRGVASPASSVYSQPVSQVSSLGQPVAMPRQGLSQYSEPRRAEQSIEENILYAQGNSIVLNSLTREVINCQFLIEELPFEQLSKIQKQKLKVVIVKIDKIKTVISVGISRPIYIKLNKIISRIATYLRSEGSSSEFLPRTEGEIAPVEQNELIGYGRVAAGHICGSTTSVYGAGRKRQLLSPAMYSLHNVNDLFSQSLAKRNN